MKNILFILITGILTIGIMGCSQGHQAEQGRKPTQTKRPKIDWSKTDPIAFLDILKENPDLPQSVFKGDWVREEHVAKLMELIDSKEPCAPVVSPLSSYYPTKSSTVGNEAMFLIEGFRKGHYPPDLCSEYHFKGNPDEYRKWWSGYKKRNIRK